MTPTKEAKSATEESEEEIGSFLEGHFGTKDIERDPKVGNKKADYRIKSMDIYVEVHAVKDVAGDQLEVLSQQKLAGGVITQVKLKDNGQKKILDRIAGKLLNECTQLPGEKMNLLVTKTEGIFLFPEDVIDSILGEPRLVFNKANEEAIKEHGATAFRTEDELMQVLRKISAIIAYKSTCKHGKLSGIIGDNKKNAAVPFDEKTFSIFQNFLCTKC